MMYIRGGLVQGMASGNTIQIRFYNMGDPVNFNKGGLAAAEKVRKMGRGDDEVLVHISLEEFDALKGMWGEPDINPNTGMPEYGWLSKIWKKAKHVIIPMIMNAVVPGSGHVYTAGRAIKKGLELGKAPTGIPDQQGIPGATPGIAGPMSPLAPTEEEGGGFLSGIGNWIKDNPLAAAGIGSGIYAATRGGRNQDSPPGLPSGFGGFNDPLPTYEFNRQQIPLSDPENYFTYGQVGSAQSGEHQFFTDNTIALSQQPLPGLDGSGSGGGGGGGGGGGYNLDDNIFRYQEGGEVDYYEQNEDVLRVIGGYAKGGGSGRDDTIEALLSDGEYFMDAETVAMLGDGSNDEGAKRLDEMRSELRKHKGKNLSRGKFSDDAKRPMEYLRHGGRAQYARGGKVKNRRLARQMRRAIVRGET